MSLGEIGFTYNRALSFCVIFKNLKKKKHQKFFSLINNFLNVYVYV